MSFSGSIRNDDPYPSQSLQAPWREWKLKSRGSGSSKSFPHEGQDLSRLRISSSPESASHARPIAELESPLDQRPHLLGAGGPRDAAHDEVDVVGAVALEADLAVLGYRHPLAVDARIEHAPPPRPGEEAASGSPSSPYGGSEEPAGAAASRRTDSTMSSKRRGTTSSPQSGQVWTPARL
jgi:hypothetical protein